MGLSLDASERQKPLAPATKQNPVLWSSSQQPDHCTNWNITGAGWMKMCGKSITTSLQLGSKSSIILSCSLHVGSENRFAILGRKRHKNKSR